LIKHKSFVTMLFLFILILFLSLGAVSAANNTTTILGNTSYGYVEKELYGNQSSNQSIVLIVGVHPLENGIHSAVSESLKNASLDLSKRYILYKVHVTQDADDYAKGRMNGQLLAQQFIVPNVSMENPFLVLDIHENNYQSSGYAYSRFLYLISNTTTTSNYANQIISELPFLTVYSPPNPTSTSYVTIPIANMGISTIVYETYLQDTATRKASDASALVSALDKIVKTVTVTANPPAGNYYAPQNVVLAADELVTIYYTLDGTDPTSTSEKYTGPIIINTTKTLKYLVVDTLNISFIKAELYQIYTLTPYSYTVAVPIKQVWYKGWYKVSYKVKVLVRKYKVAKKWKYVYNYVTKFKSKKGWLSYWIYQNQTKWGNHWVLT